jgi:hypothetical protein
VAFWLGGRIGVITGLPDAVHALLRDEAVPDWRAPMLATLTQKRFSDPRWIFEPKPESVDEPVM